jgi:hypothetical protein
MKLPLSQVSVSSKELRGTQSTSIGLTGFGCDFPNVLNIELRINDHDIYVFALTIERAETTDQGLLLGAGVVPIDP